MRQNVPEIKMLTGQDAESFAKLVAIAIKDRNYTGGAAPVRLKTAEALAVLTNQPNTYRVGAFLESRLTGIAQCGWLHDSATAFGLFVLHEYRGRGIAHQMMQALEIYCREQGVKELKLEVLKSNQQAIRVYEALGYSLVSTASASCRYRKSI